MQIPGTPWLASLALSVSPGAAESPSLTEQGGHLLNNTGS